MNRATSATLLRYWLASEGLSRALPRLYCSLNAGSQNVNLGSLEVCPAVYDGRFEMSGLEALFMTEQRYFAAECGIFRTRALSTIKCKIQEIYGRTFVFVFCVSICRNSVNQVGHVGKNIDHKDLGNRLLRLCPELMCRPVIMEKMRNYFYSAKRWKWVSKEEHSVLFQEIRTLVKNHWADDTALNTGGSVTGALRDVCEQSCNERRTIVQRTNGPRHRVRAPMHIRPSIRGRLDKKSWH